MKYFRVRFRESDKMGSPTEQHTTIASKLIAVVNDYHKIVVRILNDARALDHDVHIKGTVTNVEKNTVLFIIHNPAEGKNKLQLSIRQFGKSGIVHYYLVFVKLAFLILDPILSKIDVQKGIRRKSISGTKINVNISVLASNGTRIKCSAKYHCIKVIAG